MGHRRCPPAPFWPGGEEADRVRAGRREHRSPKVSREPLHDRGPLDSFFDQGML
jgi:hypothetical protein